MPAINGVAKHQAVIRIPERHRIEEHFLIVALKLHGPRLTAVSCFVNARRRTIADTQCVSRFFIDGIDIAKIERVSGHIQL